MISKSNKIILATDLPNAAWKTSALCANSCVRIAKIGKKIAVSDSKNPTGAVLLFTPNEWKAFIAGVKNEEFE